MSLLRRSRCCCRCCCCSCYCCCCWPVSAALCACVWRIFSHVATCHLQVRLGSPLSSCRCNVALPHCRIGGNIGRLLPALLSWRCIVSPSAWPIMLSLLEGASIYEFIVRLLDSHRKCSAGARDFSSML